MSVCHHRLNFAIHFFSFFSSRDISQGPHPTPMSAACQTTVSLLGRSAGRPTVRYAVLRPVWYVWNGAPPIPAKRQAPIPDAPANTQYDTTASQFTGDVPDTIVNTAAHRNSRTRAHHSAHRAQADGGPRTRIDAGPAEGHVRDGRAEGRDVGYCGVAQFDGPARGRRVGHQKRFAFRLEASRCCEATSVRG